MDVDEIINGSLRKKVSLASCVVAVVLMSIVVSYHAQAHLCNDVFMQAHDNLAVKVDVRDGQLRIQDEATFRVYLLNTMGGPSAPYGNIDNITLLVHTDAFDVDVRPSPDWKTYPVLNSVMWGGKKEYFEVTLKRKEGIPDGPQRVGLELVNGLNASMVFKTVDLAEAAAAVAIPKAETVVLDGAGTKEEWSRGAVCTGFHEYLRVNDYYEDRPVGESPRIRMMHDEENVYFLVNFPDVFSEQVSDKLSIFLSKDSQTPPVKVTVDRANEAATCELPENESVTRNAETPPQDAETHTVVCKADETKSVMEVAVPLKLLDMGEGKIFCVNFTRSLTPQDGKEKISYWKGNRYSADNPVVFEECVFGE